MSRLSGVQISHNVSNISGSSGIRSHGGGVLSVGGKKIDATQYAGKSMTHIAKDLKAKGLDPAERRKMVSAITGGGVAAAKPGKNSFANLGSHAQEELIKQASHSQALRDKIAKDLRKELGEHGDRSFLHKVEKVTEAFHERMRAQSLQDRLKMEGKDKHTFAYQQKAGETNIHNVGTATGGMNRADNYYQDGSADNHDDPKAKKTLPMGFNNNF